MTASTIAHRTTSLVAVPGAEFDARTQFAVFARLHARDSHTVLVDTDSSDCPDSADASTDFNDRVDRVLAAVDGEIEAGRAVHLFGAGLGAAICIAVAAARGTAIGSLTILAGWLRTDRHLRELIDLGLSTWEFDPMQAQRWSSFLELSPQYRRYLGPGYDPRVPSVPVADAQTLRRLRTAREIDVTDSAERVRCSTLVIVPTRDLKVSADHSYELVGAIDGAASVSIASGHGALVERVGQIHAAHCALIYGNVRPGSTLSSVIA